jgi:alanyl-tRNA synthetase
VRTSDELREGFLSFFESKGHRRLPSAPLVPPADDPSTLFVVAGMQPFKKQFLGLETPAAARVTTSQKVMRAGGKHADLDDVGTTARHASFFEMLGNFSFGDYFKDEAVAYAWEFVTEHMGFPPERLWTTVFAGDPSLGLGIDEVAVRAWERVGVPPDRIVGQPRSENFWQAAETGPCGPCSEIFLDRGEQLGCGRPDCGPNCGNCERFLEFWNLVFMEFDLGEDGSVTPLPKQNIDTGLGLERGAMLLQGVESIFDTDGYQRIMEWVARESGVRYGDSPQATKAHRVLADHGRAMTFLIAEGIQPSNEGRGYIVRRLIRRAVQQGRRIGLVDVYRLPGVVIDQMAGAYPELREHAAEVERIVKAEEERFRETLERGMREFDALADRPAISGEDAFRLAATYGFPIELTVELAEERGQAVDVDGYRAAMADHRETSRGAGDSDVQRAAEFAREAGFRTEFAGYEQTEVLTQIGALEELGGGRFLAKLRESPFYAEGGGQVSDQGVLEKDSGERAELVQAFRFGDDQALLFSGHGFAAGDRVRASVPWHVRFPTMANHTATHLLHRALREVLGEHVRQAGSAVRPDKLRFDFTHERPLTPEQRELVERRVNEKIFENLPVHTFTTPIDEARRLGATMLFGEKYGDVVRVVEIGSGEGAFSRELCGGTHVRSTAEIGAFKILSESSVGAATRRIEAVTSGAAASYLFEREREAERLREELEAERKAWARLERQLRAGAGQADEAVSRLLDGAVEAGGIRVVVGEAGTLDADALLELSDRLKQKAAPAAVVIGAVTDGRVNLVANFAEAAVERGVSAGDVIRTVAGIVGGGGGGRPTMARAGGKDPSRLGEALDAARTALLERLRG